MATLVMLTCDICKEEIGKDVLYFAAGVYGVEAHLDCFNRLTASEVIVFLSIDDVKIMKFEDWQNATKANSYFRRMK